MSESYRQASLGDLKAMQDWAAALMASREPDLVIGDRQVLRWFVVPRNPVQNVYLHLFLKSDDGRALHDHPADNVSWLLRGEYLEHLQSGPAILRREGERIERVAEQPHRVEIVGAPVTSLFISGVKRRDWGFHCPRGWVSWQDFPDASGSGIGKGCEP
jgi:hypothetical protein